MKSKKRTKPERRLSNQPQDVSPTAWYYEEEKQIDLIVEAREKNGDYLTTVHVRIPYRQLLGTLKRAGKVKP